jgi:hypothetical protein
MSFLDGVEYNVNQNFTQEQLGGCIDAQQAYDGNSIPHDGVN